MQPRGVSMRFKAMLKIQSEKSQENKKIPTSYRKGLNSLLKEALQKEDMDFFIKYYKSEANKQKPFTFSSYIPDVKTENKNLIFDSDAIQLNFSTSDLEFFIKTYNGLLKIKEYPFFNYNIRLKNVNYNNPVIIKENEKKFKTMSPVLLRDYNDRNKSYLLPDNPQYVEQLQFSILSIAKRFLKTDKVNMEITINKFEPVFLFHYKEIMKGADMEFSIKAPSKVLQLIYDIGLGSRRSEGFGMLEII